MSEFMRSRPFQTIEDELGMKLATLTQGLFFSLDTDVIHGSQPCYSCSGRKTDDWLNFHSGQLTAAWWCLSRGDDGSS